MAQPILLKRTATASKVPLTTDLQLGELAINTNDGRLFLKKNAGTDVIVEVGAVYSVAGKTGAVTLSLSDIPGVAGLTSPAFSGTPTAPTPASTVSDNTLATTAFVKNQNYITSAGAPVQSVAGRTGAVTLAVADVSGAAPLASPVFTGAPNAPTAPAGDNTTLIATTQYVQTAVNGLLSKSVAGGSDVTLSSTENGNNIYIFTGTLTANINVIFQQAAKNFTVINRTTGAFSLTVKTTTGTGVAVVQNQSQNLVSDGTNIVLARSDFSNIAITGSSTAPTQAVGDNSTLIATTAFVKAQGYVTATTAPVTSVAGRTGAIVLSNSDISGSAPLASPALTGTPTAPTAVGTDNSTTIATTAFVKSQNYITSAGAPVQSVAGRTGAVTLAVADVSGAAPTANPVFTGTVTLAQDPTQAMHAVTKQYADAIKQNLDIKDSVVCATNAPIGNLSSCGVNNVDGVVLTQGMRVLVKNGASPDGSIAVSNAYNGIYVVGPVSGGLAALTRASDCDSTAEVTPGLFTFVEQGVNNANAGFVLSYSDASLIFGTTLLNFTQFSGAGQVIAGNGLNKLGNTVSAVGTTNRISVSASGIDIASTYVGQTSITTLGTISSGTWNGSIIGVQYGGTGATSISGLVYGNGTGAMTAATAAQISTALGTQNISGNAANVTGTVAIANGGTGTTNAPQALVNLGAFATAGGTLTGQLILVAGSSTVAPMKFQSGVLMTTPAAHSHEWDGTNLYMVNSGGVRKTIAYTDTNITGTAANVSGTVAIANGGTGATSAGQALTNLGAAPLASPTFTGIPAAPTAAVDTNTTQVATTAFVIGQAYAKLASPAFSGTPTAPTAATGDNSTTLATTAFVKAQSYLTTAATIDGGSY
jgi:hypothetical protein